MCTFHKNVGLRSFLERPVNITKAIGMQIRGESSLSGRLGKECGFILEKEYLRFIKNCHQGLRGYPKESKSLRVTCGMFSLWLTSANVTLVLEYIERQH